MALPVLETGRVRLRPLEEGDARTMLTLLRDADVSAYLFRLPQPFTEMEAYAFVADVLRRMAHGDEAHYALVHESENTLLGAVTLRIRQEYRRAELGYWLGRAHRGQGYMTVSLRRLVRFGFESLRLNRIFAHALAANKASIGVLKRAGMQHEATLREAFYLDGCFADVEVYGLLREDYRRGALADDMLPESG